MNQYVLHSYRQPVADPVASKICCLAKYWSEWQDLNLRPPRPERGALPDCATLRLTESGLYTHNYCVFKQPIGSTRYPRSHGTAQPKPERLTSVVASGLDYGAPLSTSSRSGSISPSQSAWRR